MVTFLVCLALLVGAYFTYGRYLERLVRVDPAADTPCRRSYDGVDYIPLPMWKTFLIQLLNIAGLGPIFGAVLGAAYGPVAFLWITFGGIFMGPRTTSWPASSRCAATARACPKRSVPISGAGRNS